MTAALGPAAGWRLAATSADAPADLLSQMDDDAVEVAGRPAARRLGAALGEIAGADPIQLPTDPRVRWARSRYAGRPCLIVRRAGVDHVFVETRHLQEVRAAAFCFQD